MIHRRLGMADWRGSAVALGTGSLHHADPQAMAPILREPSHASVNASDTVRALAIARGDAILLGDAA